MDLSLFYFADDSTRQTAQRYELLLQGARFADTHDFAAVWTPERHFHRFGGNYPNPAVTGAAVAAVTERVAVRAGSVVAPLHNPKQIAEDWWLLNKSSNGRAGISLASGWNRGDFVLNPNGFDDRSRSTIDTVHTLREIWESRSAGEPGEPGGSGGSGEPGEQSVAEATVTVNSGIPLWFSSGGSPDTFAAAGHLGAGVLTHLASQTPAVLAERIREYRKAFLASGFPGSGHVVLMLHAYVGQNESEVERDVRAPLEEYLISAMNLMRPTGDSRRGPDELLKRARLAVQPAYEKYMRGGSLIGTVGQAFSVAEEFSRLGVDEIACLIDFGLPTETVLNGLNHLDELRAKVAPFSRTDSDY
ncbi:MupA/Atu3671 family FMN-dependent luciferase-like monooxygenase [Streptomyces tsukubensis]|uniref:Luciferase-like domain-containing protein n=1 Tax=Streptomyces tsukubensis TaxID=83656 RepID=A0A1V4ACJ4_9ACTN|nr:MupA/Atu3671 family FMN-dependent luciferase-like monooxygenase [Streptomyces tsukubensis]OON81414.1 hypothetical protein B1H18_08845 [Streptomyces tsukubensis]QFR95456.1 LLM class flavin-dependent oxidoreductase [Streptomyces tsukubensis]